MAEERRTTILTPEAASDGADGAYGGGGGEAAPVSTYDNFRGAEVAAMAVLAAEGVPQGRTGLSLVARMEEMVDLAAAQASAWAPTLIRTALPETAGRFGGGGNGSCCGGGGGALGGAIFKSGRYSCDPQQHLHPQRCGQGRGRSRPYGTDRANNGGDSGAAIFSLNGSLTLESATISDNFATGAGGGVVVVADPLGVPASVTATFRLFNTIISRNGSNECILEITPDPVNGHVGTVDAQGSGNLILNNNGCPGVAVSSRSAAGGVGAGQAQHDRHAYYGAAIGQCRGRCRR